ncbi:hypothetical protein GCM10023403_10360 [Pseudonocardia benzenivorans]|uniref:hypothetical protein n=1 Tax=Pseudonocardia benzenivorans TaxID=228005 RepID=UPI0031F8886D
MSGSSSTFYSTISGSGFGLTIPAEKTADRPKTPPGLIATQAVQTAGGWLGQVIVDKQIVWESTAHDDSDDAVDAANKRVVDALRALFAEPTT